MLVVVCTGGLMRTRRVEIAHLFLDGWLPECTITYMDPNAGTNGHFAGNAERWDYVLSQGLVDFFV